jgi:hypothetical protein
MVEWKSTQVEQSMAQFGEAGVEGPVLGIGRQSRPGDFSVPEWPQPGGEGQSKSATPGPAQVTYRKGKQQEGGEFVDVLPALKGGDSYHNYARIAPRAVVSAGSCFRLPMQFDPQAIRADTGSQSTCIPTKALAVSCPSSRNSCIPRERMLIAPTTSALFS